jgi:hypothetical protein
VKESPQLPPLTEAAFQRQVIALARLRRWKVAHFRAAKTAHGWRTPVEADGKGFPDLVLIRGAALVVAELKVRGRPTAEQMAWLAAFRAAGVRASLWTPAQWDEIERVLGGV